MLEEELDDLLGLGADDAVEERAARISSLDMPERNSSSEWAKRDALLDHLDRRRIGVEQAMWQAPALTVAAQAFLLPVLANADISRVTRGVILVAGIAASFAAFGSLIRLRSREVLYSEALAMYQARFGLPELRPGEHLPRKPLPAGSPSRWDRFDKWLQDKAQRRYWPPMYVAWCFALLMFGAADVAAFWCAY